MRKEIIYRLSALLILGWAGAAAAEDLPEGAFGWMDELAGHCWSAVHPDGSRDTQCYSTQFGRFLRGTIEIGSSATTARPPYRGDSVFVWNGERSEIAFHYWSSAGNTGTVTGRVEGAQLIFPAPSRPGAPAVRTVWMRLRPDAFQVVQQRQDVAGWSDVAAFTFERSGAAE